MTLTVSAISLHRQHKLLTSKVLFFALIYLFIKELLYSDMKIQQCLFIKTYTSGLLHKRVEMLQGRERDRQTETETDRQSKRTRILLYLTPYRNTLCDSIFRAAQGNSLTELTKAIPQFEATCPPFEAANETASVLNTGFSWLTPSYVRVETACLYNNHNRHAFFFWFLINFHCPLCLKRCKSCSRNL